MPKLIPLVNQQYYFYFTNKETETQQIQDLELMGEEHRFWDFELKMLYYNPPELCQ